MKRKLLLLNLVAATLSLLGTVAPGARQGQAQASQMVVNQEAKGKVLNSTVRLSLITRNGSAGDVEKRDGDQMLANGSEALGTLVHDAGSTYLVTHDHWSKLTNNLIKVRLSNAEGELLMELDRETFYGLIRYRDGGTMVLEAPDALSKAMQAVEVSWASDELQLEIGDEMLMAYLESGAEGQVTVERVRVTAVEDYEGLSSLKLRNLSGKVVVQGNSGGGVFMKDLLVANVWATLMIREDGEEAQTDQSRAARVELRLLDEEAQQVGRGRLGGGEI